MKASWFRQHINWTYILILLLTLPIAFIYGFVAAMFDVQLTESHINGVSYLINTAVALIGARWVLKEKKRNNWWLLPVVAPFGWLIPLVLPNNSTHNDSIVPRIG